MVKGEERERWKKKRKKRKKKSFKNQLLMRGTQWSLQVVFLVENTMKVCRT